MLHEAFQNRKFKTGTVKFPKSDIKDAFIQEMIHKIATASGSTPTAVEESLATEIAEMKEISDKSPLLMSTMAQNAAEQVLFGIFQKTKMDTESPTFAKSVFFHLVACIKADHKEFFPLRSFIDRRRWENQKYEFAYHDPLDEKHENDINTAAASPNGTFVFNIAFMQKLMDYSHLKGIKPKGKKYESNGGDIPDEYGYIEFLILHELLHFSHDDFYYQHIIPDANNTLINWVGDFRSNYILAKSGYEMLPIGLFNDNINYDRQESYVKMYNLIKEEHDKLQQEDKEGTERQMDKLSDDHKPGQEEGKERGLPKDAKPTPGDIDENAKRIEKQMEGAGDESDEERKSQETKSAPNQEGDKKSSTGNAMGSNQVDYTKIHPSFDWKSLLSKFINSATPKTEETYARPSRKSMTGMGIAAQLGAAAIRPSEQPTEILRAKLAFVIDSSGSMSGMIQKVYANAYALLKTPKFRNMETTVVRFSGEHKIYKVIVGTNKAAEIHTVTEKPKRYDLTASSVFTEHFGGGTQFSGPTAESIRDMLKQGYNTIFFLDAGILDHNNFQSFVELLKKHSKHMFVVFDTRETYISCRQATGISTSNFTHF